MEITEERKKEIKAIFESLKEPIIEKYGLNRPDKVITFIEYKEKVEAAKEITLIAPPKELNENEIFHFLNYRIEAVNNLIKIK